MRKSPRLALAAMLLAAAFAPSAQAGTFGNDMLDIGSLGAFPPASSIHTADCESKGLWGIPATTGATVLADGTYFYTVTATVGGSEKSPCNISFAVVVAGAQDAALLQWNQTPGATAYTVYRDTGSPASPTNLVTLSGAPLTAACPSGAARCTFLDTGAVPEGPTAPPAYPAAVTQANSHPDVRIAQSLTYDDAIDVNPDMALKTNLFHFPPGLLSNPLATTAKCKLSDPGGPSLIGDPNEFGTDDPNEDTCPRASLVGTVQTLSTVDIGPVNQQALTEGDIYNGVPTGTEAGRLFVVLRPVCSAGSPVSPGASGPTYPAGRNAACTSLFLGDPNKQLEKSFLSAKANVVLRSDGTYGIDVDTTDVKDGTDAELSKTLNVLDGDGGSVARDSTFPLQVQRLTQHLFGFADQGTEAATDDLPFMTLPTSCGTKSLSSDAVFHASSTVFTDAFSFTPTDCGSVPFAPKIQGTIDGSGGNSGEGGHPAIDVTITQAPGESATKTASVQLPPLFGVSIDALSNTCPEANLQAGTCPAGAQIGTAEATSPLSATPLSGPVMLVEVPNALPKLSVFLFGVANLRLDGNVTLVNGALVNTFDNIPELPLTSFRLSLKGGQGGLLQNSQDLCSGVGSLSGTFTGYNGATVPANAALTPVGIPACAAAAAKKPKAKFVLRGVGSGDPTLSMLVRRGSKADASLITRVKLLLGKGLRADVKQARTGDLRVNASRRLGRRSVTIRKKSLTVRRLPGGDSPRVRAKFRKGSLNASRALQRKGKGARVRLRLRVKTKGGRTFKLKVRVKAKS